MKEKRLDKTHPDYKEFDRQVKAILTKRQEKIRNATEKYGEYRGDESAELVIALNRIDKECGLAAKELMRKFEYIYKEVEVDDE